MPTVAQIQNAVDNWVGNNQSKLVAVQDAYYAANGRYFQGITTPDTLPDNGETVVADYSKKPTDQIERWSDVFTGGNLLPSNVPAQIAIDVYDGPLGKGWAATLRFTKSLVTYQKTWSFGPEDRGTQWITAS